MRLNKTLTSVLTIALAMPLNLLATIKHAPPNFNTAQGNAIFIDFQEASYNLSYNPSSKSVSAVSKISFESSEEGLPLFDLVETPSQILLDGQVVSHQLINSPAPDNETKFRMVLKNIKPGLHTLEISSPISKGINFVAGGVSSAFWYSDLDDRSYLEAYLPANYEYDQYKMTFNIDFNGLTKQKIYANGIVSKIDDSKFSVEYPSSYTSSSGYFHTAPIGRYAEKNFSFRSIDGRDIPVTAYAADKNAKLENLKNKIVQSLTGLESQYGPFLHPTLTVFNAGSGGMEYCGATMSEIWALNHELTHSYFARGGLMPANGNAGWLDEAITTWSDEGSPSKSDLGSMRSNMAGHSQYRRYTDREAYTKGKNFFSHLHYKFQANGGLNTFLNQLIETDSFRPMTTEEFIKKISVYYSEDLTPIFKKYVYAQKKKIHSGQAAKAPVHMKMTIDQMAKYL